MHNSVAVCAEERQVLQSGPFNLYESVYGLMNIKCPACGAAKLVHDTRDVPYTYKGVSTTIEGVTGDVCPACGEVVLQRAEGVRHSAAMAEFYKQVNAWIVDPD